jgi:hypothetical protein
MLVLSLGVPRSGTVFVFNVLREIWTARGVEFSSVNTNYPETAAFLRRHDFLGNVLLHAHNVLPEVQRVLPRPDVRAFFNYRDPRDVVVSLMRLHDYTFEKCMELAEIAFAQYRQARNFPSILFIPYSRIASAPESLIAEIAGRIGVALETDEVARIRESTSIERHRDIMRAVGAGEVEVQVRRNPRRVLRESRTHFINDRHIQSGAEGRWRTELSAEQRDIATRKFAPLLAELGLDSE